MLSRTETSFLEQTVCGALRERPSVKLLPSVETGVYLVYSEGDAWIGAETHNFYTRGLTLLFKNLKEGNHCFEICQMPYYSSCGLFLETELPAAMAKQLLQLSACLGMNLLVLQVNPKSFVSLQTLQQLNTFSKKLGIELLPYLPRAADWDSLLPAFKQLSCIHRILLEKEVRCPAKKLCAFGLKALSRDRKPPSNTSGNDIQLECCGTEILCLPVKSEKELFSMPFFQQVSLLSETAYRGNCFQDTDISALAAYLWERASIPHPIQIS